MSFPNWTNPFKDKLALLPLQHNNDDNDNNSPTGPS